jgi:hypothetical protein
MWDPRPLTTLGASTACNRDIFTFFCLCMFSVSGVECSACLLSISFGRCHFCCICLWMLFHYVLCSVLNSYCYFICLSLNNFVIFLVSFLPYVKVGHIFWCSGSVPVFCVCGAGCFMILFVLYLLLCCVFFIMFSSFSFASLVIGYVFTCLLSS